VRFCSREDIKALGALRLGLQHWHRVSLPIVRLIVYSEFFEAERRLQFVLLVNGAEAVFPPGSHLIALLQVTLQQICVLRDFVGQFNLEIYLDRSPLIQGALNLDVTVHEASKLSAEVEAETVA